MTRIIHCTKLKIEAEGLDNAPMPGAVGEKIYAEISREAWQSWLEHQTMLINEYRLSMIEAKSRNYLREEMNKFLFGEGSLKPEGFVEKL